MLRDIRCTLFALHFFVPGTNNVLNRWRAQYLKWNDLFSVVWSHIYQTATHKKMIGRRGNLTIVCTLQAHVTHLLNVDETVSALSVFAWHCLFPYTQQFGSWSVSTNVVSLIPQPGTTSMSWCSRFCIYILWTLRSDVNRENFTLPSCTCAVLTIFVLHLPFSTSF
jgi:hypothetical protein